MRTDRKVSRWLVGVLLTCAQGIANAAVGLLEISSAELEGPITVFYPSAGQVSEVEREGFRLKVALYLHPRLPVMAG